MITVVAAFWILGGNSPWLTSQTSKPSVTQLQEKVYPLTKAMEVVGQSAVLDGHGATLTGSGKGIGLHIGPYGHITVKNLKLSGFATAVLAQSCPDLTLQNVFVTGSEVAIRLEKVSGGLIQGMQVHGCGTGAAMESCTKVIFEKSDLSQNRQFGLQVASCSSCVIRDNKMAAIGEDSKSAGSPTGCGISITDSLHSQVLRNVAIHCKSFGIEVSSSSPPTSSDNTIQANEISWTLSGTGLAVRSEADDKILSNAAGFCKVGFQLTSLAKATVNGNLAVGNNESGLIDEKGVANTYDSNAFVAENGGPVAMELKGSEGVASGIRLLQNVFMGYLRPLKIENVSPMTMQSNSFPWLKSADLGDIAAVTGKMPIALDNRNEKPELMDLVNPVGSVAQLPTIYDRFGGVNVASPQQGDIELVVEGSLSGAFEGEQEVLARYKGPLPIDLSFPSRFEMFLRVQPVGAKPVNLTMTALLGDNSMAKDMAADDSGDTLFTPSYAIDGDTITTDNAWKPPKGKAGEWWEVDLKGDKVMTAFSIMPSLASPNDFWTKFHIAISSTGLFKGEETTVLTETNWPAKPGPLRIYRFPPVTGRYIRIYGDVDQQGVQLKQFGVYGVKQ